MWIVVCVLCLVDGVYIYVYINYTVEEEKDDVCIFICHRNMGGIKFEFYMRHKSYSVAGEFFFFFKVV